MKQIMISFLSIAVALTCAIHCFAQQKPPAIRTGVRTTSLGLYKSGLAKLIPDKVGSFHIDDRGQCGPGRGCCGPMDGCIEEKEIFYKNDGDKRINLRIWNFDSVTPLNKEMQRLRKGQGQTGGCKYELAGSRVIQGRAVGTRMVLKCSSKLIIWANGSVLSSIEAQSGATFDDLLKFEKALRF